MAQTIKLKRSSSTGAKPTFNQLALGEMAINTNDGALYIKRDNGTESIVTIHDEDTLHIDTTNTRVGIGNIAPTSTLDVTGTITAQNLTVSSSATIPYDNSISGLTATTVQSAISEINNLLGGGNIGSQASFDVHEFTATASQTTFDLNTIGTSPYPSYIAGYIQVFLNGVFLSETDYTATDGQNIVLGSGAEAGDLLSVVILDSFDIANQLRVLSLDASAATNTLTIDSSSNVGIGTDAPTKRLHVHSGISSDIVVFENDSGSVVIGKTPNLGSLDMASDANFRIRHGSVVSATFSSNGNVGIGTTSPAVPLHVYNATQGRVAIENASRRFDLSVDVDGLGFRDQTAAVTRMILTSAGNVGIGTTDPNSYLGSVGLVIKNDTRPELSMVSTNTALETNSHQIRFFNADAPSDYEIAQIAVGIAEGQKNRGTFDFLVNDGASLTSALHINRLGNVGIGTDNPDGSNLHIKSTADVKLTLETDEDSNCWINFSGATSEASIGYEPSTNMLRFANAADGVTSNVRMSIDAFGKVGIGNTAPTSNLTIGSAQSDGLEFTFDSTNTYRNRIANYWNSSNDTRMDFEIGPTGNVAPTAIMSVGYGGKVGIGTTSPASPLNIKKTGTVGAVQEFLRLENNALGGTNTGSSIDFYHYTSGNAQNKAASIASLNTDSWPGGIPSSYSTGLTFNTLHENTFDERMRIDSSGNVGIGTSSPTAAIHATTAAIGYTAKFINTNGASDANGLLIQAGTVSTEYALNVANTAGTTNFMVVKGNGNVGIGTTTPSDRLVVQKDSANIEPILVLKNDNTTDDNGASIDFSGKDTSGNNIIYGRITSKYTNHATEKSHMIFTHRNDSGTFSEWMRVTHDAHVGIGTPSPSVTLHVDGPAESLPATSGTTQTGIFRLGSTDSGDTGVLDFGTAPGAKAWLQATDRTNVGLGYTLLLNPNGGDVGIGTDSPDVPFHVSSSLANIVKLTSESTTIGPNLLFANTDGTLARLASAETNTLRIETGTSNTEMARFVEASGTIFNEDGIDIDFRVESVGNENMLVVDASTNRVGVGVADPLQTLHVSGSVFAAGYYITALQGNAQLTNTSTSSGSNPSYIGQGLISVTISDAKAKENFGPVEENECLNKVVSLAEHVKKFDWINEDWKKEKGRTVGMVAQEIYEDHSEFVHKPENYDDDGWAIRHQEMVPTLIKAIQEQQELIKTLEARIAALES